MKAVLLSGGIDSAVAARSVGATVAIAIDYGQTHAIELEYAEQQAAQIGAQFVKLTVPIVPAKADDVVFACRNAALASVGAMVAAAHGCDTLAIGCNASDWQRFPDCRPLFWSSMREAFRKAEYPVSLSTPLLNETKVDVIRMARVMGVDLSATWSCYSPKGREPCGSCLACSTRNAAMEAA